MSQDGTPVTFKEGEIAETDICDFVDQDVSFGVDFAQTLLLTSSSCVLPLVKLWPTTEMSMPSAVCVSCWFTT